MKTLQLRVRVAAAVAITCIGVVFGLAIALHTASEELEKTLVDHIVSEEIVYLVRHHLENPSIVIREPGANLQYYVAKNTNDLERIPEPLRNLQVGQHEIGLGLDEQHVIVREVDGTRFIVAYDAGPHEIRQQQFKQLLLLSIGAAAIIAAGLGYWIAGLITRQITDLSARVAVLDPGSPRAPLVEPGQDPEVAALAHAFDEYQSRIRALIEREQEFTGNASHELRTPLTAIRTSCELLETEAGLPEKTRARIAAISGATVRMTGQIEMLLFLARAQAVNNRESVALADSVNAAIEPLHAEIQRKALQFENNIPLEATVSANRHALHLVLTNLLRNAVQYTPSGSVRIDWKAPTLKVTDTGPGIPEMHRERMFDRHFRGSDAGDGFGLGLAIVKRACDHCGWSIAVSTPSDDGTAFELTLS